MLAILGIDPTRDGEFYLSLDPEGQPIIEEVFHTGRKASDTYVKLILGFLEKHNVRPSELSGIVTRKGPGPFTGLRVGVTIANALSFSDGIPHIGTSGDDWYARGRQKLGNTLRSNVVEPEYGQNPDIQ